MTFMVLGRNTAKIASNTNNYFAGRFESSEKCKKMACPVVIYPCAITAYINVMDRSSFLLFYLVLGMRDFMIIKRPSQHHLTQDLNIC